MKIAKFTLVALLAAIVAVGCSEENVTFGGDGNDTHANMGFLSLADLNVDCRIVESDNDNGVDPTVSTASTRATRASVDASNFDCSIINEENEVVMSFKYSERPTEPVELETGDYILKIQSGDVPGAAWETPIYGTEKAFKIVRNETESISEVVCSLLQIMISVSYSDDLYERLGEDTKTTVTIGGNSLVYVRNEKRAGYFLAPQLSNNVVLAINGTYAADGNHDTSKPTNVTKELSNIQAGQHRKVHFFIEHAAEGNINIGVSVRDWVTDEIIPCNVSDLIAEEEWTESGEGGEVVVKDPSIEWIGYDISKRTTINENTTGEIVVRASKGIKEMVVRIESETLKSMLPIVGLVDVINLTHLEKSYDSANPNQPLTEEQIAGLAGGLKDVLGFKYGEDVLNQTEVLFSITSFMGVLSAMAGEHDFNFMMTDNEDNTLNASLMLKSNG